MEDNNIIVNYIEKPDLKNVTFIEGLPGIGNVGKLAAEHLIDEVGAKKFLEIYSKHFPPQVLVDEQGLVRLVGNEMYYLKRDEAKGDLVILVGDYQGLTPEGQYDVCKRIIDIVREYELKHIYTLGGYGTGKMIEKPRVLGAVTRLGLIKKMEKAGVVFSSGEPGSGIVGASGLILGFGKLYDIDGVCLMGETSGYFVDPKGAQVVLEVLAKLLEVKIDMSDLETKAKDVDKIASKLHEIEQNLETKSKDDLTYIG